MKSQIEEAKERAIEKIIYGEFPNNELYEAALEKLFNAGFDAGRDHSEEITGIEQAADHAAWSIHSAIETLVEATKHLLDRHDCDGHGHEGFRIAQITAEKWLSNFRPHSDESLREAVEYLKQIREHILTRQETREALNVVLSAVRPSSWVSVEERLPDEGVYLVTVDDDSVDEPTVFVARLKGEDFVTNDEYEADIGSVTAWMPYPAPHTEDKWTKK